jgi:hypothetical protein
MTITRKNTKKFGGNDRYANNINFVFIKDFVKVEKIIDSLYEFINSKSNDKDKTFLYWPETIKRYIPTEDFLIINRNVYDDIFNKKIIYYNKYTNSFDFVHEKHPSILGFLKKITEHKYATEKKLEIFYLELYNKYYKDKIPAADQNKSAAADQNKSAAADQNKSAAAEQNKSAAAEQNKSAAADQNKSAAADQNKSDEIDEDKKDEDKKDLEIIGHFINLLNILIVALLVERLHETIKSFSFRTISVYKDIQLILTEPEITNIKIHIIELYSKINAMKLMQPSSGGKRKNKTKKYRNRKNHSIRRFRINYLQ